MTTAIIKACVVFGLIAWLALIVDLLNLWAILAFRG